MDDVINATKNNVDAVQENITGGARKVFNKNKVKKNGMVKEMEPRMKKVSVEMKKMRKERWSLDTGGSSGDEGGRYQFDQIFFNNLESKLLENCSHFTITMFHDLLQGGCWVCCSLG